MNSTPNFRSYTVEVDFEGIKIPLPSSYRYITRDEYGFVKAWRNRPELDAVYGDFTRHDEMPITLGHDPRGYELPPVVRKYRKSKNQGIISLTGIIPQR